MADPVTYDQMEKLLQTQAVTFANAVKGGGGGGGGGAAAAAGGGATGAIGSAIAGATGGVRSAFDTVTKSVSDVNAIVQKNIGTWNDLSNSGATFGGSIVDMNVAAKGARLDLGEMSDVVKKNNTAFIGLGGSVGQGTNSFMKLSKEMFDSSAGYTDNLTKMGYSTKEINDVLALQVGFQRATLGQDQASRDRAIESAAKLATEMDAMSKLTGKTRAEQEDALKKAQADAQVEAKMRLIGIQQGPEAEAKAREMYAKQYMEAQARGEGQMFKEVFATGRVVSQEAANQMALNGEQARNTAAQARATAAGDLESANEYGRRAQEEAVKNQNDVNKLTLATYGEAAGAAGKQYSQQIEANRGLYDATAAIRKESAFKDKDEATILAEAKRRIALEQENKDKEGRKLAGAASTESAVLLGNRLKDVESALFSKMVKPINDGVGPALDKLNVKLNNVTAGRKGGDTSYAKGWEEDISRGMKAGATGATPKSKEEYFKKGSAGEGLGGYLGSDFASTAGGVVGTIGRVANAGFEKLAPSEAPKPADTTKASSTTAAPAAAQKATLDDVVDHLKNLNTKIQTMNDNTESIKDLTGKQIRATRGLSNDRFAQ